MTEHVQRRTIRRPWHQSNLPTLSCQYFESEGLEEKAKARKAAVLKLVWPWPPAWAAAFTYFPSLQLKLSQAFRPVYLIGRWTWKNPTHRGSFECFACFQTDFNIQVWKRKGNSIFFFSKCLQKWQQSAVLTDATQSYAGLVWAQLKYLLDLVSLQDNFQGQVWG